MTRQIDVQRLDTLLFDRGFFSSREKARRAVMAGLVDVEGRLVDKPGTSVEAEADLAVRSREPFVSRAGRKLAAALDHFAIDPVGLMCLDIGASTGGFTDCLLQRGARRVIAVDVGYGQLDHALRTDPRVTVMERVNARYLDAEAIGCAADLVTIDVSFISLAKIVPAAVLAMSESGRLLPLIKPQFEAGRGAVGKGGIVRDPDVRARAIDETILAICASGLECVGSFDSPVQGAKGNREAFALFRRLR